MDCQSNESNKKVKIHTQNRHCAFSSIDKFNVMAFHLRIKFIRTRQQQKTAKNNASQRKQDFSSHRTKCGKKTHDYLNSIYMKYRVCMYH